MTDNIADVIAGQDLQEEFERMCTRNQLVQLWDAAQHIGCIAKASYGYRGIQRQSDYVLLDSQCDWPSPLSNCTEPFNFVDPNVFIDLVTRLGMTGFYDCNLCFVVADNVPEEFRPYVAAHEAIECALDGVADNNIKDLAEYDNASTNSSKHSFECDVKMAMRFAHSEACLIEIVSVFYRGEEFSKGYARWLCDMSKVCDPGMNYFDRAVPGFVDRYVSIEDNPLTILINFYAELKHEEFGFSRTDCLNYWPWISSYI